MTDTGLVLKDYLTMGTAVIGAVLGILNMWNSINQRSVRLRVRPAYAINTGTGIVGFSIEVTNLSAFPITVAEVGFQTNHKQRVIITQPVFADGGAWPRRLEPRSSLSAYFLVTDLPGPEHPIGRAYVRTSCGEFRYGSSPALRQVRKIQKELTSSVSGVSLTP